MQRLIVKIFCLLVPPHLILSTAAITLGSRKRALHFIDRETEAQSGPVLPRVMQRGIHAYRSPKLCHPGPL